MTTLRITGVCFLDSNPGGVRLLTVRKRGTSKFMLVGGKLEPGETARDAAVREVAEEVGVVVAPGDLRMLGEWVEDAANEPGWSVDSTVFVARGLNDGELSALTVSAEIAELRWLDLALPELPLDLAPLLSRRVIPALRSQLGLAAG